MEIPKRDEIILMYSLTKAAEDYCYIIFVRFQENIVKKSDFLKLERLTL